LISGAGSLPLHVLPLLVFALIIDGSAGIAEAGLLGSAYMFGQLVTGIALPLLRIAILGRSAALCASILFVSSLWVSLQSALAILVTSWLLAGMCCGALLYLGTTAAATYPQTYLAFSLRLGTTLLIAGFVLAGVHLFDAVRTYASLVSTLAAAFAIISAVGLVLYRPMGINTAKPETHTKPMSGGRWSGLLIVYLLFTAQVGFWAYVIRGATEQGLTIEDAVLGLALCKMAAALIVMPVAHFFPSDRRRMDLVIPGLVLMIGVVSTLSSAVVMTFVVGLLCWEVGFNVLSARLQSRTVEVNPADAGMWLTAVMMVGAATGPVVQGLAISNGFNVIFMAFVVGSALMPAIWEQRVLRAKMIVPL